MFKSVFSQKHKSPSRSLHVVLNGKSRARFLRNVKSTHDVRNKNEARQRVLNWLYVAVSIISQDLQHCWKSRSEYPPAFPES